MRVHVSFGVNCIENSRKSIQGLVPNGLMQIPGFVWHIQSVPTFKRSHASLGRRFPRSGNSGQAQSATLSACVWSTQSARCWKMEQTKVVCPIAWEVLIAKDNVIHIRRSDKHCFFRHLPPPFPESAKSVVQRCCGSGFLARLIRGEWKTANQCL
jgi:hypothetical protein